MPKLSVSVPHNLTQQEATQRLQNRLQELQQQHGDRVQGLESQWDENRLKCSFSTMGVNVRAEITVEPSQVTIDTELPMIALMFKGLIEQQIRNELGQALA
jgi:putative polyhydroxyalkanoate system protein